MSEPPKMAERLLAHARFNALERKLVEINRQLVVPAFAGHLLAQFRHATAAPF